MPFHRQETVICHTNLTPTPNLQRNRRKILLSAGKDGGEGQAEGFDAGTVTVKVTIKMENQKISNTNTDTPEFFNKVKENNQVSMI